MSNKAALTLIGALLPLAVIALVAVACTRSDSGTEQPPGADTPASAREPTAIATADSAILTPTPGITSGAAATAGDPVSRTQSRWVQDRITAVESIWGFSEAGRRWLETYDLRQMIAQPSWYGSGGYKGWAGAGQAVPRLVMHELSHSFWGAFGVQGVPALSWAPGSNGSPSEGIARYRADLETFMTQPPDRFEPLRDRFRNFPNLTVGEYPDLFHFGEADLIYMTGGDLDLVPPILRKYLGDFLGDQGVGRVEFASWPDALEWYLGMSDEDRRAIGEVFGLQHFPLARYESLKPVFPVGAPEELVGLLHTEERQRLRDFAEQFDAIKEKEFSLVDAGGVDRGFQFWRDYIREIRDLHRRHRDILRSDTPGRGAELAEALDFYLELEEMDSGMQSERVRARLDEPAIRDLAVLLDAHALVNLFAGSEIAGGDGLGAVFTGYAERLAQIVRVVDEIIESGRDDPALAAERFEGFLESLDDDELRSSLNVALDLMRGADADVTGSLMPLIKDSVILRLLDLRPEVARSTEVTPARLLEALRITEDADLEMLMLGVRRLFENSSGNFEIDRTADEAVYDLLVRREGEEQGVALSVLKEARGRLLPWIDARPEAAASALSADVALGAELVAALSGVRETAAATVHRLVAIDPALAAEILLEMERNGVPDIMPEALNQLAYDAYWADLRAGPSVNLLHDADFLARLSQLRGQEWLRLQIELGVTGYEAAIAAGELEPEFRVRHADTLERLANFAAARTIAGLLRELAAAMRAR